MSIKHIDLEVLSVKDELEDVGMEQTFVVRVAWSPESGGRLTEGDIQEEIERLAMELDEEAAVEVEERMDEGI